MRENNDIKPNGEQQREEEIWARNFQEKSRNKTEKLENTYYKLYILCILHTT